MPKKKKSYVKAGSGQTARGQSKRGKGMKLTPKEELYLKAKTIKDKMCPKGLAISKMNKNQLYQFVSKNI
tara:strand:+ start:320 stop:529 length:210 start_codon:yes stop_codon:yes gene_type:complete